MQMNSTSKGIGANIGEMLAVAMAEGGQTIANAACRFTNMTDACCIAGVKFPKTLSKEAVALLEWINMETKNMCEWWDESAEEARYCLFGEILVKYLEHESCESIKEYMKAKLATIKKEVRTAPREADHFDDSYGFDEESLFLVNNRGCSKDSYEEGDEEGFYWWRQRAG